MERKLEPDGEAGSRRSAMAEGDPWHRNDHSFRTILGLSADWDNRQSMRGMLAREGKSLDVGRMRNVDVVKQVDSLLGTGSLRLAGIRLARAPVGPGNEAGEATEEEAAPVETVAEDRTTWVSIKLVDMEGDPIPDERYRITLEDGSKREGKLDRNGVTRVSNLEAGVVKVCFPDLDESAWEAA